MSQFGHFTPYEVVPDPFATDEQTWDDDVVLDEPTIAIWEGVLDNPFEKPEQTWDGVQPDPFATSIPAGWDVP